MIAERRTATRSKRKAPGNRRIAALQALLRQHHLDAAIFISTEQCVDASVEYFCGFTCGFCLLLVRARGKGKTGQASATLVVPGLELEIARKKSRVPCEQLNGSAANAIEALVKDARAKRIGINSRAISALHEQQITERKTDIGQMVSALRQKKSKEEIAKIRAACRASDRILEELARKLRAGRRSARFGHARSNAGSRTVQLATEADVKSVILASTHKEGLMPSFDPIVASGTGASMPHYHTRKKPLSRGFLIIDMGVRYDGYCSDCTRTFFIGKASAKEKALYERVLAAQKTGVELCVAGTPCHTIDAQVRGQLGTVLGREFIHGLGHGVGVEIHEAPTLNGRSKEILEAGMVVTVEPGVYRQGTYGIRIEDTVVVREGQPEILTRFPKRLIELG